MEYVAAFVLGSIIGSFLNVVVYRMPSIAAAGIRHDASRSLLYLASPLSFCPHCATPIKPWLNIPIVSYLVLRGKAACCGKQISLRYVLLEALAGFAAVFCLQRYGLHWQALAALLMCSLLLAIAFIDLETYRLPSILLSLLLWLGLFANTADSFTTLQDAVYAAMGGFLFLQGISFAARMITGKQMVGEADPFLVGAIGAWLGVSATVVAVMIGSLIGAIYGSSRWLLLGRRKRHLYFPFGPCLATGAFVMLIVGDEILGFYFNLGR